METKKIMVPTDFSETAYRALLHAAVLAEQTKAEIHLVHVVQYATLPMLRTAEINLSLPGSTHYIWESKRNQMETIKRWVLQQYNVSIHTAMPEGGTVKQLTLYAKQHKIDLIILHDTGKKNIWTWLLGNKASDIQRKTTIPVITMLDAVEKPFNWNDVVIPVTDIVPEARIKTIASFAEKFKITIHFVALQAWGKAKKPFNVLLESLQFIKSKCDTRVVCKELKGDHLHEAARNYAEKIHASALMENNGPKRKSDGILNRITRYFEKTDYPYLTPGMI